MHVDAGDDETRGALQPRFGDAVRWFSSDATQGPGGGRNRLIREARSPIVASFDDDSWPLDADYFALAAEMFQSRSSRQCSMPANCGRAARKAQLSLAPILKQFPLLVIKTVLA